MPQFEGGQEVTGTWNKGDGELSIQLEGLENGKDYVFKIIASNGVGAGEVSEVSQVVTPQARKWHWAHPKFANNSNTPIGKASSGIFPVAKADSNKSLMVTWQSDAGVHGNFRNNSGSWASPVTEDKFQGTAIGSFSEYDTAIDIHGAFFAGVKYDEEVKRNALLYASASGPSFELSEFSRLSSANAIASNPQIITDGSGKIIVLWNEYVPPVPGASFSRQKKIATKSSTDEVWDVKTVNDTSVSGFLGFAESIAANESGSIITAWQHGNGDDGENTKILASYMPPGGELGNYSTVVSTFISKPSGNAYYPVVKMDNGGNALVVWRWSDGKNYRIQAAYRPNGVDSEWSAPVDISAESFDAVHKGSEFFGGRRNGSFFQGEKNGSCIEFDSAGNAQIVWTVNEEGLYRIQTAEFNAANVSWSTPVTVSQHLSLIHI